MTRPLATVGSACCCEMATKPAFCSEASAEDSAWPTTLGTSASPTPWLTLRVTTVPSSAWAWPFGSWSNTMPACLESLGTCCTFTLNPALVSREVAWSTGRLTTVGTVTCFLAPPLEMLEPQ